MNTDVPGFLFPIEKGKPAERQGRKVKSLTWFVHYDRLTANVR